MDIATQCMEDLVQKLNTVDELKNKVVSVYTEDDMMDAASQLKMPCVGIIYEGMRSVPDMDKGNKGLSVELVFAVMLMITGKTIGAPNLKSTAASYLDHFRNAIKDTRSPAGPWWKFMVEAAVEQRKGAYVYMQRWSTTAQITAKP